MADIQCFGGDLLWKVNQLCHLPECFDPRLCAGGDYSVRDFILDGNSFDPRLRAGGDGLISMTMRKSGKLGILREPC